MALRACCNANGFFEADGIANAIYFAVNNGAKIINMSFGGPTLAPQVENAIAYAKDNDVLVIAAAGNYSSNNDSEPFYPANLNQVYDNIISVASTTSWDHLAYFSNYGANTVDIAAPGQEVKTTGKANYYLTVNGTSFSTPFVTAVASQLRRNGSATAAEVKNTILNAVKTFSALSGKVKDAKALQFVTPYTTPTCGDSIVSGNEQCDDGNVADGDGCSATCTTESSSSNPVCGNNILEAGEQCDDGNTTSDDGCSATCQAESTTPVAVCGNNTIETGEECDDGNTTDGDGCSAICETESTPAGPACGDGTLDEGEQCDDGNLSNGDGCNAICETEENTGGITPESIIPVATGMNGTLVFHHEDHLTGGNVDTDSTGAIISLIDYYPFGDTRLEENSGDYENDYKFTGKEKDEDTGLYYYESRYYDSAIGRFTAVDPWGGELTDPQTLNKYAYVRNNPLKYVDPSGEVLVTSAALGGSYLAATSGAFLAGLGKVAIGAIVGAFVVNETMNMAGEINAGWNTGGVSSLQSGIGSTGGVVGKLNSGTVETYPAIGVSGFSTTTIPNEGISSGLGVVTAQSYPHRLPDKGLPNSTDLQWNDGSVVAGRTYGNDGAISVDTHLTNHGNAKRHPLVPHIHEYKRNSQGKLDRDPEGKPLKKPKERTSKKDKGKKSKPKKS